MTTMVGGTPPARLQAACTPDDDNDAGALSRHNPNFANATTSRVRAPDGNDNDNEWRTADARHSTDDDNGRHSADMPQR